jgi:hypothetical protein
MAPIQHAKRSLPSSISLAEKNRPSITVLERKKIRLFSQPRMQKPAFVYRVPMLRKYRHKFTHVCRVIEGANPFAPRRQGIAALHCEYVSVFMNR